ncbi:response regulator transcription factor [Breznakiella homolactica]|uniref:Response regulator n=1 Tax=Breznakiella homolactica TaxID=2798577 RepID=A0A7T7XQ57_9SPIR|nr:response regulator [Breznakiella homolactica]QQO10418.1 response regulator [Breznakiella homolactica]
MYKVLVAEDETIIRKGLIFSVDWKKLGCIVVGEAADGEEGIKKIRTMKPDIVITDVKMPLKNGPDMIRETCGEVQYESIIISGYGEFEYARDAIRLGVSEYLLKPVEIEKLEAALTKAIGKLDRRNNYRILDEYAKIIDRSKIAGLIWPPESTGSVPENIQRTLSFIENHYREKISLQAMSSELGISATSLNENLKKYTGSTFTVLLNRFRIRQAIALLSRGQQRVYEAAENTGFEDYKYFSTVFKKYVGYTPTEFIRRNHFVRGAEQD